ncbi:MAG TPA: hypothetical protein ENO22_09955 [candidate division Zixibacteria bacterium]|nr:hypothetical protein [candidate division Zixibacteria bacterium]
MRARSIFWIILIIWSGALFALLYFTELIAPFGDLLPKKSVLEQLFYALVLGPYPAFLVYMTIRKSEKTLAFQRLLLSSASYALVIFILQIMLFVLDEAAVNLILPAESNLYNAALADQISAYSRVPILSQFLAILLFIGAYVSKSVKPGDDIGRHVAIGLIYYVPYLLGFYLAHMAWQSYFAGLLIPPNKINLLLVFIHWIPTVYFLVLTYIYSIKSKK